jgi:hypothetical protein
VYSATPPAKTVFLLRASIYFRSDQCTVCQYVIVRIYPRSAAASSTTLSVPSMSSGRRLPPPLAGIVKSRDDIVEGDYAPPRRLPPLPPSHPLSKQKGESVRGALNSTSPTVPESNTQQVLISPQRPDLPPRPSNSSTSTDSPIRPSITAFLHPSHDNVSPQTGSPQPPGIVVDFGADSPTLTPMNEEIAEEELTEEQLRALYDEEVRCSPLNRCLRLILLVPRN